MHCSRCQGLMLKDYLLDMEGGFGEMWAHSWRCTNCGAIHDAVIEQHRLAREANAAVLTSGQPNIQGDEGYFGGEGLVRPAA